MARIVPREDSRACAKKRGERFGDDDLSRFVEVRLVWEVDVLAGLDPGAQRIGRVDERDLPARGTLASGDSARGGSGASRRDRDRDHCHRASIAAPQQGIECQRTRAQARSENRRIPPASIGLLNRKGRRSEDLLIVTSCETRPCIH
jgi:hypothetical protein